MCGKACYQAVVGAKPTRVMPCHGSCTETLSTVFVLNVSCASSWQDSHKDPPPDQLECKVCQTVLETVQIHKGYKIASTTKTWGKCAIHNSLSSLPSSGAFTGAFLALPGRPTVSTVHQSHSRRACRPAGAFAGRFGVISARPAERRDGKDWPTKKSKSQGCFFKHLANSPGWKKKSGSKM